MRRKSTSPVQHAIPPTRLRLPSTGRWETLRDHLVERLPKLPADCIDRMLAEGRVRGCDGPLGLDAPFVPGAVIWVQRELPEEVPVPFPIELVHQDDELVVIDKPHFLATTPRGGHVVETALVRLRTQLGQPELVPAHRPDRMTAGLVVFVRKPEHRGAYQRLFQQRMVRKEYLAVAPCKPELILPRTVRSRISKQPGVLQAREEPGEPNSETHVELLGQRSGKGLYRLVPRTGRTHQLRVHMNRLGIPICGDDLYPVVQQRVPGDFSRPLQLLAAVLEFTDPITGARRRFESRLRLQLWER